MTKIFSYLIYVLVKGFDLTFRYQYVGEENFPENKPKMLAVWHHVLIMGILAQKKESFTVMVSRSKDADPVAFVCEKNGHYVARGSSSKGGRDKGGGAALLEMVNRIKKGSHSALTVDGPTGPARQVKAGVIKIAQETKVPIIPYAPMFKSYWQFNSWDKFRLPKPFTKAVIYYGKPIDVTKMSIEQAIEVVGKAIDDAEVKAWYYLS